MIHTGVRDVLTGWSLCLPQKGGRRGKGKEVEGEVY